MNQLFRMAPQTGRNTKRGRAAPGLRKRSVTVPESLGTCGVIVTQLVTQSRRRSVLRSSCWLSTHARCTVNVGVSRLVVAQRLKRRATAHQILLLMDTLRVLGCAL